MTNVHGSAIFTSVYDSVDGYKLSHVGRAEMPTEEAKYLIYGEISFCELQKIFEHPGVENEVKRAKIICDLGSGSGRIAVALSLIYENLKKIIGIELIEKLHIAAEAAKQKLSKFDAKAANKIEFINNNFLDVDFSKKFLDADMVFLHYPMHNAEKLYLKLEKKMAAELKSGVVIVSAIRRLVDLETFPEMAPSKKIQSHYGGITFFYHKKI